MILPVYLYGQPVLRKEAELVPQDYPNLKQLAKDMYETMYNADGVGLAGPQVGLSLQILVIDADVLKDDYPECMYDRLTGLPSFNLFEDRLQVALTNEKAKNLRLRRLKIAVVGIDLVIFLRNKVVYFRLSFNYHRQCWRLNASDAQQGVIFDRKRPCRVYSHKPIRFGAAFCRGIQKIVFASVPEIFKPLSYGGVGHA